jgi:hypothetical protein
MTSNVLDDSVALCAQRCSKVLMNLRMELQIFVVGLGPHAVRVL